MPQASNQEILMRSEDYIVSKTDPKGKITYCNRIFMEIAGYEEKELLTRPHRIIRHPDMPRSVFRLLWNTLQQGREFFGIIKNRAKHGDYYWAFANVTPSYDSDNNLLGFYSVRRCPSRESVNQFSTLYKKMKEEEQRHNSAQASMDASEALLNDFVNRSGKQYDELILSLEK